MKKNIIIISILAAVIIGLCICTVARTKKAERMAFDYIESIYGFNFSDKEENEDVTYFDVSYVKYTKRINYNTYLVTFIPYSSYESNIVPIKVNLKTGSVVIFGVFEGDIE